MMRFISLAIFAGVLWTMILPFDAPGPVNPAPAAPKAVTTEYKQIAPTQQPKIKQRTSSLGDEMKASLKSAKINTSASQLIIDAIIEANAPMARTFPVDESLYDQQGEMEQPLADLNEQDMAQELALAGLNAEQNQIIIEGIAQANLNNR